jgi:hypothetical protein
MLEPKATPPYRDSARAVATTMKITLTIRMAVFPDTHHHTGSDHRFLPGGVLELVAVESCSSAVLRSSNCDTDLNPKALKVEEITLVRDHEKQAR